MNKITIGWIESEEKGITVGGIAEINDNSDIIVSFKNEVLNVINHQIKEDKFYTYFDKIIEK